MYHRRRGRCYLYTNIYICMYIHTRHTLTHRCMQEAWQVLCVYIHILLCIYMHDTNTHTMTHRCIFGGVAGALCINTRSCMYQCVHIHLCISVYTYIYVLVCSYTPIISVYTSVYTYVLVCTHTSMY